jgi:hypothetical protein
MPGDYFLSVYNLKGQQLWSHNARNGNGGLLQIKWDYNSSSLNNKVYIVKLTHNNQHAVKKFTIAH